MKSAFEIAMERLDQQSGPTPKLSDAEKASIAEIESLYASKIAEARLDFENQLGAAQSYEAHERVRNEMAEALSRLEEKRDNEKNSIWEKAGAASKGDPA